MACAVAHSGTANLFEAIQQRPQPQTRVTVLLAGNAPVPLQCRHCEDAPCVEICPSHALQKPDVEGPVTIRQELCIGCKSCIIVCPFGVIGMSQDGKTVVKCDLCIERTEQGEQPACVEACPTQALALKDVDEVAAERRKLAAGQLAAGFDKRRESLRSALQLLDSGSDER